MAWINLASRRFALTQQLLRMLNAWEAEEELIGDYRLGLLALLSGDQALYERSIPLTKKWLSYYERQNDAKLAESHVFPNITNLSILALLKDPDAIYLIERVSRLNRLKNKAHGVPQDIVKTFLNKDGHLLTNKKRAGGHVDTEKKNG